MVSDGSDTCFFFFSSRRRHTRLQGDWSSDVCSSDLTPADHGRTGTGLLRGPGRGGLGGGRAGGLMNISVRYMRDFKRTYWCTLYLRRKATMVLTSAGVLVLLAAFLPSWSSQLAR